MSLEEMIEVGRGERKSDLLIKDAQVVDVLSGEVLLTNVAVHGGRIVGFGDYRAQKVIDIQGAYLCPGLIDGHVHVESSMVTIPEFARAVVAKGTTTVVIDPHEIANVLGIEGLNYMLRSSEHLPLSVYLMLPSSVPTTHMETAGAELSSGDLYLLMAEPRVLGLAEMMNYPGVLSRDFEVLSKIKIARGKRIDGHAPGLSGKDLCAYIDAGIRSDHECTTAKEAAEKLRLGMYIMVREGSTAKNLKELLKVVTPANSRQFFFVTDDRHPGDLVAEGHIDHLIRLAIAEGLDPIIAVQMGTINAAEYFGLGEVGAVALGFVADLIVADDLESFNVVKVFKEGHLVAEEGKIHPFRKELPSRVIRSSVNIDLASLADIKIKAEGQRMRVVEIIPGQISTRHLLLQPKIENGFAVADLERDILKIAVVERHLSSGNIGLGFVKGFGLKAGAMASSVAHDSHNIIVVGTNDADMTTAVLQIKLLRGGQVVVADGQVLAEVALPIAWLMSDHPVEVVAEQVVKLNEAAKELGCAAPNPFTLLSFLALPVIPELKITDKGLVDVVKFELVSLWEQS